MLSLFQSASERDVEMFSTRLRDQLKSKFSFTVGQSKLLHAIAEINGFNNWHSFRDSLEPSVADEVLAYFIENYFEDITPKDILDIEDDGGVIYVAYRDKDSGNVSAHIIYDTTGGWKGYWESEGPFAEGCPARILDKLSPTNNATALEWRKHCRIWAQRKWDVYSDDLPYHQLFYTYSEIDTEVGDISHFVRCGDGVYEGLNVDGETARFTLENRVLENVASLTTVPEYLRNQQVVHEAFCTKSRNELKLISIGGEHRVDVLLELGR